ncbi:MULTISPECIES: lysophospholipid acyltransferase family protein [Roseobacteraceae]|jgi:1-acyl-sn-glycerol-3-phosphate acyltransferase|uniref:2-acyl-glycerophospho-ethanolamine acyltransferase n=1 Tax=Pseudosulfitobacter pseudonitzschiae TaxID=1402135 RepID=A0A221K084_9RHOB|nr:MULTISPECIES: lysophospholipid acyltransferase family protein [Roseobacteraceae]ASM72313.1 2-acyl-glycerophospho-ethanolamine acyltransferase [Pseudosulfitobacter pseudonitzschiae]
MTTTWDDGNVPKPRRLGAGDWVRVALRGLTVGALVFGGLIVLLLVRLVERPLCGLRRPVTPFITVGVCKGALRLIGLPLSVTGVPMRGQGAVVANHSSWLDIFVLNASKRIYFVSKSEVASWPGIGWLARSTGTVFVVRDPKRASEQTQVFQDRLLAGHKLLFFPEGTSTDGLRVLPFKPTLFQAFFAPELRDMLQVQPVTVIYHAPRGADARFYGWWGDMVFGTHLLGTLAARRQGRVEVIYHPPLNVADFTNRKTLAAAAEAAVRGAHVLAAGN